MILRGAINAEGFSMLDPSHLETSFVALVWQIIIRWDNMLGLNFIGTMSSDCTETRDITTYITMDHPYTVKEFVEDALRQFSNSWGYIQLYKQGEIWGDNIVKCEYENGHLKTTLPEKYMDREVYMAEIVNVVPSMDIILTLQTKGYESWNMTSKNGGK